MQFLFQGQRRDDLDHVVPVGLPGEAIGLRQHRRGRFAAHGQRQRPGRAEIRRRRIYLNAPFSRRQTQRREGRRIGTQIQRTGKRREAQLFPALLANPVQAGEVSTLAQAGEDRAAETDLLCNCRTLRAYYSTAARYLFSSDSTK